MCCHTTVAKSVSSKVNPCFRLTPRVLSGKALDSAPVRYWIDHKAVPLFEDTRVIAYGVGWGGDLWRRASNFVGSVAPYTSIYSSEVS